MAELYNNYDLELTWKGSGSRILARSQDIVRITETKARDSTNVQFADGRDCCVTQSFDALYDFLRYGVALS